MRNSKNPLTPQMEEDICAARREGKNYEQICAIFSKSKSAIAAILRKHGFPAKKKHGFKEGVKTKVIKGYLHEGKNKGDIALENGLAVQQVSEILKEADVQDYIAKGRSRLLQAVPDAAEHIASNVRTDENTENAKWLLEKTGVAIRGNEENRNSGGVTFNVAVFDPSRAGDLLARLAELQRPAVLDAVGDEDKRRAGHDEPVQAVPDAEILP